MDPTDAAMGSAARVMLSTGIHGEESAVTSSVVSDSTAATASDTAAT